MQSHSDLAHSDLAHSDLADSNLDDSKLSPPKVADFTLIDQAGKPWRLSEHLDTAVALVFLRGDW